VVGAATCSFVVTVPGGRRLVDPVVDPHEVGIFGELDDDLSSAYALSLACDRCDRHEALLRGSVYFSLDRLESFREIADGEVVSETPAQFAALPGALTSSFSVGGGLVCWCIGRQLVGGDVFKVPVLSCP
jgi:ribosomal protein S14